MEVEVVFPRVCGAFYQAYIKDINIQNGTALLTFPREWKPSVWVELSYIRLPVVVEATSVRESFGNGSKVEALLPHHDNEPPGWWTGTLLKSRGELHVVEFQSGAEKYQDIVDQDKLRFPNFNQPLSKIKLYRKEFPVSEEINDYCQRPGVHEEFRSRIKALCVKYSWVSRSLFVLGTDEMCLDRASRLIEMHLRYLRTMQSLSKKEASQRVVESAEDGQCLDLTRTKNPRKKKTNAQRQRVQAEARATIAESKLKETLDRVEEAERDKENAQRKQQEAERSSTEFQLQVTVLEEKLALAENRLEEATKLADTVEDRAREAERRCKEVEDRATEAEMLLREAEGRARVAERRLAERSTISEGRLTEHEERLQSQWVIERREIQLTGPELGRGAWATVSVATFRGVRVAAKSIHSQIVSPHNRQLFKREINMSACIRHPNLLQFIGATLEGEMVILMELMPTNLRKELEDCYFAPKQALLVGLDVARALNYLHLMKPHPLIHRDISSANVLLEPLPHSRWRAKVSDYGTVNLLQQLQTVGPGSPSYSAPEANDPTKQSPKMDIFSFGVLVLEMLTGELPIEDERPRLLNRIFHEQSLALIQGCLSSNSADRPSASEIISQLDS